MGVVELALVVAVAENGVIGRDNGLPWHLPEDLKYFKKITLGHPIIMGRRTYDSIGRPLPGRTNIVVTRQRDWRAPGVEVVHSLQQALAAAGESAALSGVARTMLIGGAELYRQALPLAQRLYLTEVCAAVEGDAHFPPIDRGEWREISRERHAADSGNPYDYAFVVMQREHH